MNLPNFISLARLFSVPLIVSLILSGQMQPAFWFFLLASFSDVVDGYLARSLKSRTVIGSFLDPIADKILLISVYCVLGAVGFVHAWLVTLVVFRDLMILGGALLLFLFEKPLAIKPLFISKLNTFSQLAYITAVLFILAFEMRVPTSYVDFFEYFVALTTLLSGAGYVKLWIQRMMTHAP